MVDRSIGHTLAGEGSSRADVRRVWEDSQAKLRSIMQVRRPFVCRLIPPLQAYGGGAGDTTAVVDAEVEESMAPIGALPPSSK